MLNIVCVNAGNYQGRGAQYVNTLFDMVARNLAEGFPGRFVCFTDDPTGLAPNIVVRSLPAGLNGWWNKLYLFKEGLFDPGDRIFYLDLDTLITGRLDEIVQAPGKLIVMRDFLRGYGVQSAVMAWDAGVGASLWEMFEMMGRPDFQGGDQAWIEKHAAGLSFWQDQFPDLFVSYKFSGRVPPLKASVVCFHGVPRPHQVTTGWVPEVWKIGGITRAELDVICNTEREVYMANVRANSARDLPWFDFMGEHQGHAVIVGGAPSVAKAIDEIKHRSALGQDVVALNGSFAWLMSKGVVPNMHVIIDARPENIGFLRPLPGVRYFLASQCHPSLFDALDGYDVTVIHLLTDGMQEFLERFPSNKPAHLLGGGTTVAMKAMLVAYQLGYRSIHLYGMDSSYADGEHHAYAQALNEGETVLDVICGERTFKCAPWMVTQATDFQTLVDYLKDGGATITVNGDGLIPTIARDMMMNPTLTHADIRAYEILKRINGTSNPKIAELGVFAADLSSRLLAAKEDLELVMVDAWDASVFIEPDDFHARLSDAQNNDYARLADERTRPFADRRKIIRAKTVEASKLFEDGHFDGVFIDADHSYRGCKADIEAWHRKIKPGGWLMGHDYANTIATGGDTWGVDRAVDEFAAKHGYGVELGENFTWFIKLPERGKHV